MVSYTIRGPLQGTAVLQYERKKKKNFIFMIKRGLNNHFLQDYVEE